LLNMKTFWNTSDKKRGVMMRKRRLQYIFYTTLLILGASVMTYLLVYDDFVPKVPVRAKEVWHPSQDCSCFLLSSLTNQGDKKVSI
jgi:hypothetical protein